MDNENDSVLDSTETDADSAEPDAAEEKETPKKKRSKKKLLIVLGVIGVVLVALGIGGVAWHSTPGFCSTVCHSPMAPYVEGFYSGDTKLLVTAHAEEGEECLDCHKATLGEQLSEAMSWISGNFTDPLPMTKTGTRAFCLECHDSEEIKLATVNYNGTARNPHDSHYGDSLECFSCHRVHRESVMYCNSCHPDIRGPEDWG